MAESTKAISKTVKCRVREPTHGLMEESTSDHISMIKSMASVHITGAMVASSKANGKMVNNMVKEK